MAVSFAAPVLVSMVLVLARTTELGVQQACTPTPILYESWKAGTPHAAVSDARIKQYADSMRRVRLQGLPDPFSPLARDSARRVQRGEVVLWEDSLVFVLVDRGKGHALVIPKQPINYIIDASPSLQNRLAQVAAATSDAFITAAGAPCDTSTVAVISINPPSAVGVRQLHIHVQPRTPLGDLKNPAIYEPIQRMMAQTLGPPKGPG